MHWECEVKRLNGLLAAAEARGKYLERQSEIDLVAARTLHPGVNSVGDAATIIGAKLAASESLGDSLRRRLAATKALLCESLLVIADLQAKLAAAEAQLSDIHESFAVVMDERCAVGLCVGGCM
jgi:hypothetical protein